MKRLLRGIIGDAIFVTLSFSLAFFLRFEGVIPNAELARLLSWLPVLIGIRIVFFYYFGLYDRILLYVGINDLFNIVKAVAAGTVIFIFVVAVSRHMHGFPRSTFIIEMALEILVIGGSRFSVRAYRELLSWLDRSKGKRALIVGAGDAGNGILREMQSNPRLAYNVVGFIDDDSAKRRLLVQGVPVRGDRSEIRRTAEQYDVDEIIIALPAAGRQEIRAVMEECEKTRAVVRILPAMHELIGGRVSFSQVREVRIEDLLGREEVSIDSAGIRGYLAGKRVMVTGAGGSIGAEICRQVLKFAPASLILFGRGENSIFHIHNELSASGGTVRLDQVIGDIINRKKLEGLFRKYAPQIVFHAGADKHVPLLELNPDEAVLNNVIGTRNVIEVAEEFGAEKVVCISTDKAADPACVMGCTKRIAEMIIQGRRSKITETMGVRFGNVLGSRGSVVPTFREQIRRGGPVRVTHPGMVRYFMTIPEAARLVLEAGTIGRCGEIFLLDMGDPVRILDLARQMIKLSGLEPEKDIAIEFTGLRPGEKLVESLTGKGETLQNTKCDKIFRLAAKRSPVPCREEDLQELKALSIGMDHDAIKRKLREVVPNYRPPEDE